MGEIFIWNLNMVGYDFNGVVDIGRFIPTKDDVIITGNTIPMAKSVIVWLLEHNIFCAVYFMPYEYGANDLRIVGMWKAEMILKLGITKFYEDDSQQAEIIRKCCPRCLVSF